MREAQKVVSVVAGQRRGGADGGPVADGLPVPALRVGAERERAGRAAVRVRDPGRGFLGRAAAVVDRQVRLRAQSRRQRGESRERAGPLEGVVRDAPVHLPVVIVRRTAAGIAQGSRADLRQQRAVGGRAQLAVPDGRVHPEDARIHLPDDAAGVHLQRDARGRRSADEGNVVHVEGRQRRARRVLEPEAVEVALRRRAETRQRNVDLLPRVRRRRGDCDGGLRVAIERRLELQALPAGGAAVNPERQASVGRGIEGGVMHVQRLVSARVHLDRIAAAVDGTHVGIIQRRPPVVLPAVFERVVVNALAAGGQRLPPRRRAEKEDQQDDAAEGRWHHVREPSQFHG